METLSDGVNFTYTVPFDWYLGKGESADMADYKITVDNIEFKNGITYANMTLCEGADCSKSTSFKKGETKELSAGSQKVKIRLLGQSEFASDEIVIDLLDTPQRQSFNIYTNGGKDDTYADIVLENLKDFITSNSTFAPGEYVQTYRIYEKGAPGAGILATRIPMGDGYADYTIRPINVEADKNGKVTNTQICIYHDHYGVYLISPNGGEISTGKIPILWCADENGPGHISINIGYASKDRNVITAHGSDPNNIKLIVGNVANKPNNNPYVWDGKGDPKGPFNGQRLPTGKYIIFIATASNTPSRTNQEASSQ